MYNPENVVLNHEIRVHDEFSFEDELILSGHQVNTFLFRPKWPELIRTFAIVLKKNHMMTA